MGKDKDGDWDPDVYAKWLGINICSCGTNNFYTIRIRWIEVPMMSESDFGNIQAVRCVANIFTF
uniref:Uncharacterized protein n=1 Tax=Meloidogyne javanica TaxID=6303 RepID=A0A915LZI4_MELJA